MSWKDQSAVGAPYTRAGSQRVKHGRKLVPFGRQRRKHGGVAYTFECASDDCNNVKEISGSKNLPDGVVCQKAEDAGWVGRGHHAPGVPAYFYCPQCAEASKLEPREERFLLNYQPSAGDTNVVSQLPTTRIAVRVSRTNKQSGGKSRALELRVPNEIISQLGNPRRATIESSSGYLVINCNPVKSGVSLYVPPKGAYSRVQVGSSRLPFTIPGHSNSLWLDFFVNKETMRLISSRSINEVISALREAEIEEPTDEAEEPAAQAQPSASATKPTPMPAPKPDTNKSDASTPQPPSIGGLTVEDGHALKEMMNQWLDELERHGFEVKLEVENNRIKRIRTSRDI